ncbi:MAG TPA: hypothetical protein VK009_05880 [Chloroflexota bacterium]|nr:hypothetical protein [Chloroflexota bacterium]
MSIDPARVDETARHLREDVVQWATRQPGFVSGHWLVSEDRTCGLGIVAFDSEQSALKAAAGPKSYRRDGTRPWNVEEVTLFTEVASA